MARRKSTGKRLRFSVFHRDHFTCQYCGAQPPDVVLVCDHIHPVAKGGESTIDNLITACESCNAGKSDRSLEDRPVRPDADLMYLEAQQEIVELYRYQFALAEREDAISGVISDWQDLWTTCSGEEWAPSVKVLRGLYMKYELPVIEEALVDVAYKVGTGYLSDAGNSWLKYLYVVARNIAAERDEEDDE